MSDIARKNGSHAVYGGVSVDIAEEGLDQVTQLLAGFRGGAYKVMGSALARAANSGKTVAKREASKKYTISQSEFVAQKKISTILSTVGAPCRSSLATGATSSPLSSSIPSLGRTGGCIPASCVPVPGRYWTMPLLHAWVGILAYSSGKGLNVSQFGSYMGLQRRR